MSDFENKIAAERERQHAELLAQKTRNSEHEKARALAAQYMKDLVANFIAAIDHEGVRGKQYFLYKPIGDPLGSQRTSHGFVEWLGEGWGLGYSISTSYAQTTGNQWVVFRSGRVLEGDPIIPLTNFVRGPSKPQQPYSDRDLYYAPLEAYFPTALGLNSVHVEEAGARSWDGRPPHDGARVSLEDNMIRLIAGSTRAD